jgi:hypothetical protein
MSSRITRRDLEHQIRRLNTITGHATEPYTQQPDGTWTPNAHTFKLSGAYGGWALHQMASGGTGERDVLYSGHVPARELHHRIDAYIRATMDYEQHARDAAAPTE